MFLYPSQTNAARTTPATQPAGPSQPAVLQTSVEPTPQVRHSPGEPQPAPADFWGGAAGDGGSCCARLGWGRASGPFFSLLFQAVAAAAQAGLLQQQAELERKAAELEKKERELQSNAASINCEWEHDQGRLGCSLWQHGRWQGRVCPVQRCSPPALCPRGCICPPTAHIGAAPRKGARRGAAGGQPWLFGEVF